MDLITALKISASGLSAQRTRINVLSSNLANANSTRNAEGTGPFQRKDPVFREIRISEFDSALDRESKKLAGVKVDGIQTDSSPGNRIYDPSHPDADKEGYVTMPNVNMVTELTDIMATSRAYEANVSAMSAAKTMINAALQIGKG